MANQLKLKEKVPLEGRLQQASGFQNRSWTTENMKNRGAPKKVLTSQRSGRPSEMFPASHRTFDQNLHLRQVR